MSLRRLECSPEKADELLAAGDRTTERVGDPHRPLDFELGRYPDHGRVERQQEHFGVAGPHPSGIHLTLEKVTGPVEDRCGVGAEPVDRQ